MYFSKFNYVFHSFFHTYLIFGTNNLTLKKNNPFISVKTSVPQLNLNLMIVEGLKESQRRILFYTVSEIKIISIKSDWRSLVFNFNYFYTNI